MEGHFQATREDLYHVQMDMKHVQSVQINHSDRLLRLERRQADDAALKSVWNSPFPSVLGGTPQQGPVPTPSGEVFEDFDDEHGHNLLGSLHLEAEDEPVRRGASRANSVRFDVSAIQGSNWAQSSRYSGDFGPARPSSGFGSHPMTERSASRHSTHSLHSAPSGRTSSLGLDTNFMIGADDDDSPIDVPEPPPGLFVMGSVPSIIRCWLNENFSHSALLYAVLCTGSQKSQLDLSLVKELGLTDQLHNDGSGRQMIRLPVYLPEAVVTRASSRSNSPAPQLPTLTADFEVINVSLHSSIDRKKSIRIFLGSDALRAHSADILFSQNIMTLYGDDRRKLSVPFVRPEDDSMFKYLCITNTPMEKIELKATALPFTPVEQKIKRGTPTDRIYDERADRSIGDDRSTSSLDVRSSSRQETPHGIVAESAGITNYNTMTNGSQKTQSLASSTIEDRNSNDIHEEGSSVRASETAAVTDTDNRDSAGGIWGSWRSGSLSNDGEANRENASARYQKPVRGGRNMKVLKPSKVSQAGRSTSAARTGAAYEPAPPLTSEEPRRKSQASLSDNASLRWESKKTPSDEKSLTDIRNTSSVPRSSNPVGGASAFAWMNPTKTKANATTVD